MTDRESADPWAYIVKLQDERNLLRRVLKRAHGALADCSTVPVPGAYDDELAPAIQALAAELRTHRANAYEAAEAAGCAPHDLAGVVRRIIDERDLLRDLIPKAFDAGAAWATGSLLDSRQTHPGRREWISSWRCLTREEDMGEEAAQNAEGGSDA